MEETKFLRNFSGGRGFEGEIMKEHDDNEHWNEDDATWQLLGKASPKQASGRFAEDVVRAVRLLPEVDPVWPRILKFSRWSLVAACVVLTVSIFMDPVKKGSSQATTDADQQKPIRVSGVVSVDNDTKWDRIEDVAQAELLAAAAEHLEEFSDQDLVTMIGF